MSNPDLWPHILTRLSHRESLERDEASAAMNSVMAGEATPAQIGAFLLALRTKGETADELEGFAAHHARLRGASDGAAARDRHLRHGR